jgi:hypothetical protein
MWTQNFEGETHKNNPFIPDVGEILMLWRTEEKYMLFQILIAANLCRYDISEKCIAFVLKAED